MSQEINECHEKNNTLIICNLPEERGKSDIELNQVDRTLVDSLAKSCGIPDGSVLDTFRDGRRPGGHQRFHRIVKVVFQPSGAGLPNVARRLFKNLAPEILQKTHERAYVRPDLSWLQRKAQRDFRMSRQNWFSDGGHARRPYADNPYSYETGEEGRAPTSRRPILTGAN